MKFEKAYVLLSEDFRYFGENGTDGYKQQYPAIKAVIQGLQKDYRVNHTKILREQLLDLKAKMWKNPKKNQGKPTCSDPCQMCNNSSGILSVC